MKAIPLVFAGMLTLAGQALAVDPQLYILDLAGGDVTTPVQTGQAFKFQIIDLLPPKTSPDYSVSTQIETIEPSLLILPGQTSPDKAQETLQKKLAIAPTTITTCQDQKQKLNTKLEAATNEGDLKTVIGLNQPTGTCQSVLEILINTLTKSSVSPPITLKADQEATVTVTRSALAGEKDSKTWTFKFTTAPQGTWLMHYGFSFLGNRDKAFFAAAVQSSPGGPSAQTAATQYKITPKATRNNLQYLPSFTFTYEPFSWQKNGFGLGLTAGLGTDLSNVSAFAGLAAIVHENVNVYVGVAGAKQQRLNGRYHSGDTVNDNLTDDQVNEKVYVPTIVFGVGFRFSTNPFSSNSSATAGSAPAKK
jgi:hypothetical protein